MSEVEELKHELSQRDEFIENLITELSEAYEVVEQIKDEVISLTLDFKHLVEALKK